VSNGRWHNVDGHARLHPEQQKGTSADTIKSWKAKRRNPVGLAAKVLATFENLNEKP
jgi:hypothetical protein